MRRKESFSLNSLYQGIEGIVNSVSVNTDSDVDEFDLFDLFDTLETRRGSLRRRKDYTVIEQ